MKGTNAYAIISSPRASGTEAMLISASWLSRTGEGDGTLNLRGVSTALALAGFLKRSFALDFQNALINLYPLWQGTRYGLKIL